MYNVLIVWAPDTAENRKLVETVARSLDQAKVSLLVKGAAEATIADVSAADIVVFGAQKTSTNDVPAEFSEFLRIFKGITLAGRTAGFFSMGSEKATARLRKALKDTEILQSDDDPVLADQKQGTPMSLVEWSQKLIAVHQVRQNAWA
jgi:flavodoxin